MVFVPFSAQKNEPCPWSSISLLNLEAYLKLKTRYSTYITGRTTKQGIQCSFIRVFRVISIITSGNLLNGTKPTGAWDQSIWTQHPLFAFKTEVGIFADLVFFRYRNQNPIKRGISSSSQHATFYFRYGSRRPLYIPAQVPHSFYSYATLSRFSTSGLWLHAMDRVEKR